MAKYGLNAYLNHGRWLIHCLRCDTALLAQEVGVVCPVCWPGINAKAFQPLPNGLLRPVTDVGRVDETRAKAKARGEVYTPIFPAEKAEIETITRLRSKVQQINWEPGESLETLREQNAAHGDPLPPETHAPARSAGEGKE